MEQTHGQSLTGTLRVGPDWPNGVCPASLKTGEVGMDQRVAAAEDAARSAGLAEAGIF